MWSVRDIHRNEAGAILKTQEVLSGPEQSRAWRRESVGMRFSGALALRSERESYSGTSYAFIFR